jgi:predicted dehydrogenase
LRILRPLRLGVCGEFSDYSFEGFGWPSGRTRLDCRKPCRRRSMFGNPDVIGPLARIHFDRVNALLVDAIDHDAIDAAFAQLSESNLLLAEAMRAAVRRGDIGQVRLAYAELDDGPIHQMHPEEWSSPAGTPWPWRDEFTVGCTIEHASYPLTWLVAMFGPVSSVVAFSTTIVPAKHPDLPHEQCGPDFSVAAIQFASGLVARLTCSIVAPHDHSLRLVGDQGVLTVDECWHFGAPLTIHRFSELGLRAETYPWLTRHAWARTLFGIGGTKSDLSPKASWRRWLRRHEMDYALGVAELAASLRDGRPCRLSADLALHVTEVARAVSDARVQGQSVVILSACSPL